ncbi:hypothetical protein A0H81_04895 [Grifola frondosa]|uniref:Uncharacterized protein n=1 Tax=Grifola frondosa TaxID=5627 RepID=A0A1C7MFY7_GRIFR|nr:hypothetical protein A0H81_04895 [Grifola frondosa]
MSGMCALNEVISAPSILKLPRTTDPYIRLDLDEHRCLPRSPKYCVAAHIVPNWYLSHAHCLLRIKDITQTLKIQGIALLRRRLVAVLRGPIRI